MKKLFLFAAAAAMITACSETDVLENSASLEESNGAPVNFDVYAQRSVTRGGIDGTNDNNNIGERGFGVFGYYTKGETYSTKATPNFMYNQKIYTSEHPATAATKWTYEPVKYWPNEFGSAAISDNIDFVTFFAYAPWTEFEPTTGEVKVPADANDEQKDLLQKKNIISVNRNNAMGDPIIKYYVDTDPATSVDLLWGVAAEDAEQNYTAIGGSDANRVKLNPGKPFIDLTKPNNPQTDKLLFNLKHALAKVKVTIDYIADEYTPDAVDLNSITTQTINPNETRIFVRSFSMSGFAMKGALNLNNTTAGEPLWKDEYGVQDLEFKDVVFLDGRANGREGDIAGESTGETPLGLNPILLENYALTEDVKNADNVVTGVKFGAKKNPGITAYTQEVVQTPENGKGTVLLFGAGDPNKNDGYFYVIPRNSKNGTVDVEIAYDVETIDPVLYDKLSDGATHGSSIENVIKKRDIFKGIDFKAGYMYEVNIHVGMTSVKISATVQPWVDHGQTSVELPDNQVPDEEAENPESLLPGTYNFTSSWTYGDDQTGTSTGKAKIVVNDNNEPNIKGHYVQIEVTANSFDENLPAEEKWVGKKFWIPVETKVGSVVKLSNYVGGNPEQFTEINDVTITIGSKD